MNILFIGGIYSDHLIPEFKKNSKSGYQFAAQALQESIVKGLLENNISVHILSFPSVSTFPFNYKKPFLKPNEFIFASHKIGETIGRINIPILKYEIGYQAKIDRWFHKTEGKKYVLIYSLQAKFLEIAKYIKETYPKTEVVIVVPDLPEFIAWNKYYERLGLKKKNIDSIYRNLKFVDKFVLLSKHMTDKLPIGEKPWIVIEGIFNPSQYNFTSPIKKDKNKIILYTGNIDRRYGIMDVVYAFTKISDDNLSLWICGFGDSENEICEYEKKDHRIKFFGSITRDKALLFQKQAFMLINPRHSNEEFTKYSFPSKTMEYLASGTPTLMCKLQCIPSEYEEHLFFIKDETIEGYKNAILNVLQRTSSELEEFGEKAQRFIIESKNPRTQVNRIISFMESEK